MLGFLGQQFAGLRMREPALLRIHPLHNRHQEALHGRFGNRQWVSGLRNDHCKPDHDRCRAAVERMNLTTRPETFAIAYSLGN